MAAPTDAEITNATARLEAHPAYQARPPRETRVDQLGYGRWVGMDYTTARLRGMSHEPAVRAMENAICAVAGLPPMWPPEPQPTPGTGLQGRLRMEDR